MDFVEWLVVVALSGLGEIPATGETAGTTSGNLHHGRGTGGVADPQTLGKPVTQQRCCHRVPKPSLQQYLGASDAADGERTKLFL
jgi:hypothetical protein